MLDAGDGHQVYWETCGNPTGKPALVLHGGPGSGCSAGWRQYFDPRIYRIVLFDQRGCGRSMPHASSPEVDLSTNTTAHLLADIELLRRQLNIERWLVLGGSWGSTLALAYTQQHPTHLTEMVLLSVGTTTALEVDWITRGLRAFFPEQWTRFRDGVPEAERKGNLVEAYNRLLMNPDPAIHEKAARDWCDWEMAIVAVHPNHKPHSRYEQPRFRLCFARLVTHYWRHNGWLQNDVLLQQVDRLAGIPAVLILCTPLIASWQLAKRWPGSECHGVSSSADVGFTKREVGSNCCAECFRPELNFLSQGLICCDPSRGGEFWRPTPSALLALGLRSHTDIPALKELEEWFETQKEMRGIAKLDSFFERTSKLASRRLKRELKRRGTPGEFALEPDPSTKRIPPEESSSDLFRSDEPDGVGRSGEVESPQSVVQGCPAQGGAVWSGEKESRLAP